MKYLLIIYCLLFTSVGWGKDINLDDLIKRDGLYYEKFTDVPFTGDAVGQELGKIRKGIKVGKWIGYYENGKLKYKSNYKNGKREGEYLIYQVYEDGKIWVKGNFKDGKGEGEFLTYYVNGQLEYKRNFKDGKLENKVAFSYYENGQLRRKENYKDGKKNGEWLWYFDNGQLKYKTNYKDGKKDGEYLWYYEDGQLEIKKNYNKITQSIIEIGFENSASIYSISQSAKTGGDIGWISENSLNKNIKKNIDHLKIGEISKPIILSTGILLLKVVDSRSSDLNVDLEVEYKKAIDYERNRQLNQYSEIYYNKIKKNLEFNG